MDSAAPQEATDTELDPWDSPADGVSRETPKAVVDAPYGINPRNGKPYVQSPEERSRIGQFLTERRAAAAAAKGRKPGSRNITSGKATRPGKPAPAPRAKPAAKEEKRPAAFVLAEYARLGASLTVAKNPVRGSILMRQADAMGPVLAALAAEDTRVEAFLDQVVKIFSPVGAWGEFGLWAGQTVSALMISSGKVPGGLVGSGVAMIGGAVLTQAVDDAARRSAAIEAGVDRDGEQNPVDPERIEAFKQHYISEIQRLNTPKPKPAKPTPPQPDGEPS